MNTDFPSQQQLDLESACARANVAWEDSLDAADAAEAEAHHARNIAEQCCNEADAAEAALLQYIEANK